MDFYHNIYHHYIHYNCVCTKNKVFYEIFFSVNVTKSVGNSEFGHITKKICDPFLCSDGDNQQIKLKMARKILCLHTVVIIFPSQIGKHWNTYALSSLTIFNSISFRHPPVCICDSLWCFVKWKKHSWRNVTLAKLQPSACNLKQPWRSVTLVKFVGFSLQLY